jgi:alpha-glucoside transport system substrate-binding protein
MALAVRCLLALSLCAVGGCCAPAPQGDAVTILVPWEQGTAEYAAFQSVIRLFTKQTGITVAPPENSRATVQDLDADLNAGDPPDLVDLPSPAALDQFKGRGLRPLSIDLSHYDQPWRGLAELGTGPVYAVPVKADIKSLLWYDKHLLPLPPENWQELVNFSRHGTPWCLGLASGSASGWPGADWVAEILLSKYHVATYTGWLGGGKLWATSPEVSDAWTTWGELMGLMRRDSAIYGGPSTALQTDFRSAADGMSSGKCELTHGALAATDLKSPADYDYVQFPSISNTQPSPIVVSGDFMASFTSNPNAEKLLAFLATDEAQELWVRKAGYAFSADRNVTRAAYPKGVEQQIARLFQQDDSATLCFGADDMMQPDVSTAFQRAVLHYVSDPHPDPGFLETLLKGIQQTQNGVGASPVPNLACAKPDAK